MKKQKKRIFLVNDASFLNTGYSIYGKEILSRLHQSDKFEVAELGCYCDISNPNIKNIPWKFYPNAVVNSDSRFAQYKANNINQFGLWRFNRCLIDFKPHIVFDIRDYWMFAYQEASPYKKYFNWVIMPATDSAPPKTEWLFTFCNADVVMPYTQWAKKTLENSCGHKINLFSKIANAGINPDEFYPIDNKKAHQYKYFNKDVSITGLVMRNQRRKLIPDIMMSYKKYLETIKHTDTNLYKKSYLYLHTSYPEDSGWDIPNLLVEYSLADRVYFTYVCKHCDSFFPSKFHGPATHCKNCNNYTAMIANPSNGVKTCQLNEIYNLFDLFIQYAICEGFGMPQVEAAACGLQIASVDYSAMTEIVESVNGIKIPVQRMFRELETNADRAYPDIEATTQIIYNFFTQNSPEQIAENSIKIRQKCIETYTWDQVYRVWEECFDNINIDNKPSWESIVEDTAQHLSHKVPKQLNNTEFVEYICNNVINEPSLLRTANIQSLIRDFNSGIVTKNGSTSQIGKQQVVEILDSYLNNKIMCEKMRNNSNHIIKEDFLQ